MDTQGRHTTQRGRHVCPVAALHPTVPSVHSHATERCRVCVLPWARTRTRPVHVGYQAVRCYHILKLQCVYSFVAIIAHSLVLGWPT